jgi:hypothetical protein
VSHDGSGNQAVTFSRRSGTAPELPESGNFRAADGAMMEFGGCPRTPCLNPLRAGLVRLPEQYEWSSAPIGEVYNTTGLSGKRG